MISGFGKPNRKINTILMVTATVLLSACTIAPPTSQKKQAEGFAVYLLAQTMSPNEMLNANLNSLALADEPIFSTDDIVSYSSDTHEIELSPAANERIRQLGVPTSGTPFVVTVDGDPIYGGAFWVGYSSLSFDGIVIDTLSADQNRPIRIQLGYPESPDLFTGEDFRSDPRILQSLKSDAKLK